MFFSLSKIIWFFLQPLTFLLTLMLLGLILRSLKWKKLAFLFYAPAIVLLITLHIYPLGDHILFPLENRFHKPDKLPEKIDGIIILGGSIETTVSSQRGSPELNNAAERVTTGFSLAQQYPEAKVIFTGGLGRLANRDKGIISESSAAQMIFTQMGLKNPGRLLLEHESRNTHENALFSKKLINDDVGGNWLLVTTASHMPRSVGIFRKVGWNVIPYPVDFRATLPGQRMFNFNIMNNLDNTQYAVHEWIGLLAYYYTDKTTTLFPK